MDERDQRSDQQVEDVQVSSVDEDVVILSVIIDKSR